jgi:sugar phosphate permease
MFKESNSFYGWKIVWVGIIGMILIYGIRHSFAVFFTPILEEFSWSRGNISIMMSLNVLIYGFVAPVAGILAERWKVRILLPLGIGILGAATAGCAYARELWHFYVLFGALMPVGSALSGWPIIAPAIMAGMVVGVLFPLYLLFFYYRPEDKGLKAYGSAERAPAPGREKKTTVAKIPVTRDWTFAQILHSSQLWLLVFSYALYWGVAGYLVLAHQVRFAEDAGYSSIFSVTIFALFGVTVFLGQMSGFLSDRVGREKAATLASALSILALASLLSVRDNSQPWLLYVYSICFGFGGGLFTPTIFAGSADIFYGPYYGTVSGLLLTGMGVGAVFGPWLGGYIYDVTGSYRPAFVLCMACIALSCLILWIAAPRKGIKPKPIQSKK